MLMHRSCIAHLNVLARAIFSSPALFKCEELVLTSHFVTSVFITVVSDKNTVMQTQFASKVYSPCYSPCVASQARKPTRRLRAWQISPRRSLSWFPSFYLNILWQHWC